MKYQCNDCGKVFDESEAKVISVQTSLGRYTDYCYCHYCHSENLTEDYKEHAPEEYYDKEELRGEYWMEVERGN